MTNAMTSTPISATETIHSASSQTLITLVPVLNRPHNVAPLIESFRSSKTPGLLVFVATRNDTAEIVAVVKAGGKLDLTEAVTWPEKINASYRTSRHFADWILFCADDVRFHEGWWEATKPLRDQPEIMVIGTNDLGNLRVIAGEHATHPLVRSSYIGTVDDPDAIVHTGYNHWFVDDEFVTTAKIRGCWASCPGAVIEHLHPYWDEKIPWDDVYAKGESKAKEDQALWESRIPLLQALMDA